MPSPGYSVAVQAAVAVAGVVAGMLLRREGKKRQRTKTAVVSCLYYYPIKSCLGYELKEVELDSCGFKNDRRYMVITTENKFVTMRQKPKMALIKPTLSEEGNTLTLEAPDMQPITVTHPTAGGDGQVETATVDIWGDAVDAVVVAGTQEWLTTYLGTPCRLVATKRKGDHNRVIDPTYNTAKSQPDIQVGFQDGFPMLITSEESLVELNSRLPEPVDMRRFRTNIVVKGCKPHEEDTWKKIRINGVEYDLVKKCARCSIPTVNPDTAKPDSSYQPIKTMRDYRSDGKEVYFGMNVVHRHYPASMQVGDVVEVLEWH
eukprot:comp11617_c0_seq1/m.6111 comp11617_c0_seq1/g.6111  ORF comp11617_c0_seq1/g.6111 comp11617_c0_seq1/m.6111 type:complete len:317 (-) comp11617_c0_seq1:44-994(-)